MTSVQTLPACRFLRLKTRFCSTNAWFEVHAYNEAKIQAKMMMLVALMAKDTDPLASGNNHNLNQKGFPKTLLMLPTLNEADAIQTLVREAKGSGFKNILVVDGYSTDRTREAAEAEGAEVVLQEFGKGKGCGVRTGMKLFLEREIDLLCILDADVTNIPSHLLEMVRATQQGRADVVLGSRIRGKRDPEAMNALTFASNLTVSLVLGAKFKRLFTDVQTGYWAFTKAAVQKIYPLLHSTGFEIEIEIFVTALKAKLKVCEVPVGFRVRTGTSKFSFRQRFRNLYYAMKYLVS